MSRIQDHDPTAPEAFRHSLSVPEDVLPSMSGAPLHEVSKAAYEALLSGLPMYPVGEGSDRWLAAAQEHAKSWTFEKPEGPVALERGERDAIRHSRYARLLGDFCVPEPFARLLSGYKGSALTETIWNGEQAARLEEEEAARLERERRADDARRRNAELALQPKELRKVADVGYACALTSLHTLFTQYRNDFGKPIPTHEVDGQGWFLVRGWPVGLPKPEIHGCLRLPDDATLPPESLPRIKAFDSSWWNHVTPLLPDQGPVDHWSMDGLEDFKALIVEHASEIQHTRPLSFWRRAWLVQVGVRGYALPFELVAELLDAAAVSTTTRDRPVLRTPADGRPYWSPNTEQTSERAWDAWTRLEIEAACVAAKRGGVIPVGCLVPEKAPSDDQPEPWAEVILDVMKDRPEIDSRTLFDALVSRGIGANVHNPRHHARAKAILEFNGWRKVEKAHGRVFVRDEGERLSA